MSAIIQAMVNAIRDKPYFKPVATHTTEAHACYRTRSRACGTSSPHSLPARYTQGRRLECGGLPPLSPHPACTIA